MAKKTTSPGVKETFTPDSTPKSPEQAGVKMMKAEEKRKQLVKEYTAEPRVPIVLAPQYAAHFGNVMRVTINGISIAVRVDGSTQKVPQTFADEIHRRRRTVDKMLMRLKRMANIPKNAEQTPGELTI